jgi:hypothetical protein
LAAQLVHGLEKRAAIVQVMQPIGITGSGQRRALVERGVGGASGSWPGQS